MAKLVALGLALPSGATADAQGTGQIPESVPETVIVVAHAPLAGGEIDLDKLPGEAETLSLTDILKDRQQDVLPNAVATQLSSVSLNDEQGSPFQPAFVYRGFEASPISGIAEGIAVYQDGVRLNESFGDNVNWDLVPEFAVQRFTLESDNPAFGLNAIGGAVSLNMKTGFDFSGERAELSGGSFGNLTGDGEFGAQFGKFGFYLGIGGVHDDGFRYQSPTALRQAYSDLAYESGSLALHLSASGAVNDIGAVGPTPVQMLAANPRAVFTHPQSMHNEMELGQFRGTWTVDAATTLSFNAYYRHFAQRLVDGNTTDVDHCVNDAGELCLEGHYDFPDDALFDTHGVPVPASVLPASATPGETDYTHTDTSTSGAAVQASWSAALFGRNNHLVAGASIDHGDTSYGAYGELGTLLPSLQVVGSGVIIDQSLNPTAQPPIETPVSVESVDTYTGLYALDIFDLTDRLSWSASARLNLASISLHDRLGHSLNGSYDFSHLNPGTGVAYKLSQTLTAYLGYSQSNRAPTAGELSCANPASPCLLDAFLVSDPALKQVISHDFEMGLRGNFRLDAVPGALTWDVSLYRTDADRDILLLATQINGFGYFQNAGTTRHQGIDAHLGYRDERWSVSASYSYLDATFRNAEILSSNSPSANADGFITVKPGDRIPMNPAHRLALSADWDATSDWSIGADLRWQSSQYLVGDESNQQPPLPGFVTVNLRSSYRLSPNVEAFGEVQNLFNKTYYTYATFTHLDGLPPNINLTNPRTYSPAPGRLFSAGLRVMTN